MKKIHAVFVWLGGVITETVSEAASRQLYAQPAEKITIETRLQLRELAQELALGRLTGPSFCRQAIEATRSTLSAEDLAAGIQENVTARSSVLEMIKELPETYQRWLISDYPPKWFGSIAERLGLFSWFDENRLIITAAARLSRITPDIFYYLAHQTGQPLTACLMIDGVSARAVEAVKHGLDTAIFVDARRLRREFVLRRMLPPPPGFIFPGTKRLTQENGKDEVKPG